jgi:cell division protease FtsH
METIEPKITTKKFGDLKSFKKKLSAKAEKKLVNYDFKEQVTGRNILISLLPIILS